MTKPLLIKSVDQLKRSMKRAGKNRVYHAFKYTQMFGRSPYYPHRRPVLVTEPGAVLKVKRANTNPNYACGAGVNVGTKAFCVSPGRRYRFEEPFANMFLFLVEFRKRDIACVPKRGGGKWRLFQCKVIKRLKVPHRARNAAK
jgi:hypothetical protein